LYEHTHTLRGKHRLPCISRFSGFLRVGPPPTGGIFPISCIFPLAMPTLRGLCRRMAALRAWLFHVQKGIFWMRHVYLFPGKRAPFCTHSRQKTMVCMPVPVTRRAICQQSQDMHRSQTVRALESPRSAPFPSLRTRKEAGMRCLLKTCHTVCALFLRYESRISGPLQSPARLRSALAYSV